MKAFLQLETGKAQLLCCFAEADPLVEVVANDPRVVVYVRQAGCVPGESIEQAAIGRIQVRDCL